MVFSVHATVSERGGVHPEPICGPWTSWPRDQVYRGDLDDRSPVLDSPTAAFSVFLLDRLLNLVYHLPYTMAMGG